MDHGGDDEPNLVPLLDLVLQLVMFFMMCANFVMEQVDQTVVLPDAVSAKPMKDAGQDVIFLNVNSEGHLLVVGKPKPLTTNDEMTLFLRDEADASRRRMEDAARKAGRQLAPEEKIETTVIIRAHKDARFEQVYRIMRTCQDVGLRKLQLRAIPYKGA